MGLAFAIERRTRVDEVPVRFSYSGFSHFRHLLARLVHINLDEMAGFAKQDGESWPLHGDPKWDAIHLLLNHSDCDGDLSPEACELIAPRLKELSSQLGMTEVEAWYRKQGERLAQSMRRCAEQGLWLVFW